MKEAMTFDHTGSLELYLSVLRRIIGDRERNSFLDICCGEMTATRHLHFDNSLHIDIVDWGTRPPAFNFKRGDALKLLSAIDDKSYGVALCSDGIEHLRVWQGHELIDHMERIAYLPIIFTPIGEVNVDLDATHPDAHKSGWDPSDFQVIGWRTEVYPNWHSTMGHGAFFAWKE